MYSAGITFMLWGVGIFIAAIIILILALKFFRASREIKREMEKAAKLADLRLRMRYNRIATLEVGELHSYLTNIFARCLELITDQEISKADPDAEVALFTLASEAFYLYLGTETINAIEYYYGVGYLDRWTTQSYKLLNKRGMAKEIINNKTIRSETIQREMVAKMQ